MVATEPRLKNDLGRDANQRIDLLLFGFSQFISRECSHIAQRVIETAPGVVQSIERKVGASRHRRSHQA
jgi:hypothetical protein